MTARWWLIAALATMAACGSEQPPQWHQEAGYRWRELSVRRSATDGFTKMGRGTGIRFQNSVADSVLVGNRMLAQGAGIAIGDVDGDGLPDVFIARTQGKNALYKNRGNWEFTDVAHQAGVEGGDRYSSGATLADIDGDKDLDLILLATTGPNAIFVNDGAGKFAERRDLGLDSVGRGGTTPALADVDGDGDLDLYVANYKPYSPVDTIPPQQRAMNQMVRQMGAGHYEVVPELRRDFKLVNRPDMGGLNISMRGEPDDFYINEGGRFTRTPLTSDRFRDADGKRLTEEPESFTLDARFVDLNNDGAPDLYVANDFEDQDQLWFGDGKGGFRLAGWQALRQISNSSMGLDAGDVNGDGLPDLFVVDMLSNDTRRLRTQIPTHTALPKRPGDIQTQLQQQRNTLFLNRGDGTFAEAAFAAGVAASGWSWSTMMQDVDLDGWQDILVANGHLWDLMDADVQESLQNRLTDVQWQRQRWQFPQLKLKNVAFRNRGDMTFEDVSDRWNFADGEDVSHTLAAGDLDGDGDLDVIVNRLGSPALVLRNDANAARVAVRLVGDAPNTQAIGARVRLLGGAVPTQEREVTAGGLYMSHSDALASFAMGTSDNATLVVDWRDGRRTTIEHLKPNRLYEISALGSRPPDSTAESRKPRAEQLFTDATAELGGHTHTDPGFDDWERQFLLPNSLAQFGPGASWFDYDRDGDEDLLIGAGKGGRIGVFRNDGGRLTFRREQGAVALQDFTTVLGMAAGTGARILAGVSSWEEKPELVSTTPAVGSMSASGAGVGASLAAVGAPFPSATGPIALGDYDGDGDLDVFVGGRAIPGAYPRSATSQLFRNEGGRFGPDSARAPSLVNVGLVSAAEFADVDGDGDADLLLAREWGSILLLVNDGGKLAPARANGLERWTSRWNGIATGDLNGDGRLDIVATSWGRNTMMPADSANPLVLVHGPFGSGGEEEMLLARNDARVKGLAPLNSYARARVVIRDLATRVRTFGTYADVTVDQLLGSAASRTTRDTAVSLDHMLFINRGDRFEAVPLPLEAQMAPAFYAGVADFDGDGLEDVFLSQNFFPTTVGIPRYDEGRGLLLRGDGKGGLMPLPASRSGILVYGDQRGAAYSDFDRDGRLDVVVTQNAAATRLFRNTGARPGLRVRLHGPAQNPDGVGAQLRLVFGGTDASGPVREVHAGSGYWSQNGAVQVFGIAGAGPSGVWVRWPGGQVTRTPVATGAREVVVAK